MDISRKGAERDRGRTKIVSGLTLTSDQGVYAKRNVRWNMTEKAVYIEAYFVKHTDGRSHHNYSIKLTLDDVAAVIDLIGHAGAKLEAGLLRDCLKEKVPAIVKILACATGLQPQEIPEEDSDSDRRPALKRPALKRPALKRPVKKSSSG